MKRNVTLPQFIESVGRDRAAELFEVKPRTIDSWRRGERRPRPEQAQKIVAKSPVTMQGIYGA